MNLALELSPLLKIKHSHCFEIQAKEAYTRQEDHITLFENKIKRQMSRVMRKPTFCICENKDADQLRGNREADQRLCFRYLFSTIPLLPKYKISRL